MRILIVRLSAMGDIIHSMPAVSALRRHSPNAFIGWAIEERWAPLLSSFSTQNRRVQRGAQQPLVDAVHLVNLKRWKAAPLAQETRRAISAIRSELRAQHYDAAIDLQGAIRSAVLAKMSGATKLIGEASPREYPARWWFDHKVETRGVHVVEQAHEVICGFLHQQLPVTPTEFPCEPVAEEWAESLVRERKPFAVMNPGAGWGAKCWPAERYGIVASALKQHGIASLVNVGPGESHLGAEVVARSGGAAHVVQCSIAQLIALTRRAALFIGGDTGPMHLASALQIPVVAIFGPTDPKRNGPFNSPSIVLRHPESKRDHSRRAKPEEGLLTITVEEVVDAGLQLLAQK
jgi:heptosyltransferase I